MIKPDETHDSGAFMSYARGRRAAKQERDAGVSDTVHYWCPRDSRCLAAIVTQENLNTVELTVFPPGDDPRNFRAVTISHDETKQDPGTWHWPCGGQ